MSTSNTEWHTILPYHPPVQLQIREITSVSVAFLLSSSLSLKDNESSGESDDGDEPEDVAHDDVEDEDRRRLRKPIASVLQTGLNVSVNNANWDRVLIKVDDKTDEAVIIIYNLMPGRQYDIELAFVPGVVREVIVTDEADIETGQPDLPAAATSSTERSTTSHTPAASPSPVPPLFTLEDHIAHLQHALTHANDERDSLMTSIKSHRRESQKADALLRTEIDKLKGLSEKHSSNEHRARQKTLALQEAVKRAQNASGEFESQIKTVEADLPSLRGQLRSRESEHSKILSSQTKIRTARERAEKENAKNVESLTSELKGLEHKADRLSSKKERLEGVSIKELEEKLREIEDEIEQAERQALLPSLMSASIPLWAPPGTAPITNNEPGLLDDLTGSPEQMAFPTSPTLASTSTRHRYSSSQSLSSTSSPTATTSPRPIARPTPIQRPQPQPLSRSGSLPTGSRPVNPERSSSPDMRTGTRLSGLAAPFQPGGGSKSILLNLSQQQRPGEKKITILQNPARHS